MPRSLPERQPRMALLATRDFVSVDYEQSVNSHTITVLARKRTGAYARFVMTGETFTSWMRGEGGKHLASIGELHWGYTGDTEQSLKHELDIETEYDVETRRITEEIRAGLLQDERPLSSGVATSAGYVPLSFITSGQEVNIARTAPTHLMSFMNSAGRVVAYIDHEGNYVKVGSSEPAPQPPPEPESIVPIDLTGRIIDLE